DAWLASDPRHALAIKAVDSAWRIVSAPGIAGQGAIAQERFRVRARYRARRLRWRGAVAASGMIAAALLVVASFSYRRSISDPPAHGRIVQRPDVRALPDGSTVQLNAGSEIALRYTAGTRMVH